MNATQKQIQMAAKLYEMRDAAKSLLGERYADEMAEYGKVIRILAKRRGISELAAATAMSKDASLSALGVLKVMAAVVEMTEPSA